MPHFALLAAAAIGVNAHIPPSDALDLATDLGVEWIRIDFAWDVVELGPGAFDWTYFDVVLEGARARGLKVFASVGGTPAWASTGDRRGDGPMNDVPDAAAYRAFVAAAVARYD